MPNPPMITAYLRNWSLDDERSVIKGWIYDSKDIIFYPEGQFIEINFEYMIQYTNVGTSRNNWLLRSVVTRCYFRVYEHERLNLKDNGKA